MVTMTIPLELAHSGGKRSFRYAEKDLELTIPAGIAEDRKLKLSGQGDGGGDLIVAIQYASHAFFRRDGQDIILDVPVSLPEAALGAKIDVPTLEGARLTVKIPPGASSGQRLRLKGMGLAGGDMHIEIKILTPAVRDDRGRELLEELSRIHPQQPRASLPWGA
jgi:DnaJ-class molecular chaperone